MVRITDPQHIPLSYCKSICWHLGSCDNRELGQLAGVHVSCNHHLYVLAESNWIQLSTATRSSSPRHKSLCLSSSVPSATWPCRSPQERQSILPCPHDTGLGCVTCFVQQDQWRGHQLHKYLGSRICALSLSPHEDPSQTAQEAETCVHLNQPRPGIQTQTSSSQLTDVSMRRKCLWSWASRVGRFVSSTTEDDSCLTRVSSQSHCSGHSAIDDVQLSHLELLGAQGSLSLWV